MRIDSLILRVRTTQQSKASLAERKETNGQQKKEEAGKEKVVVTPRKLFEFRERLWHEPPELKYGEFEHYDVQK